jgi:hypothetical protein
MREKKRNIMDYQNKWISFADVPFCRNFRGNIIRLSINLAGIFRVIRVRPIGSIHHDRPSFNRD